MLKGHKGRTACHQGHLLALNCDQPHISQLPKRSRLVENFGATFLRPMIFNATSSNIQKEIICKCIVIFRIRQLRQAYRLSIVASAPARCGIVDSGENLAYNPRDKTLFLSEIYLTRRELGMVGACQCQPFHPVFHTITSFESTI